MSHEHSEDENSAAGADLDAGFLEVEDQVRYAISFPRSPFPGMQMTPKEHSGLSNLSLGPTSVPASRRTSRREVSVHPSIFDSNGSRTPSKFSLDGGQSFEDLEDSGAISPENHTLFSFMSKR